MSLLKLFQTRSKLFYVFLLMLGVISSLTNLGILMQINIALGGKPFLNFGQYNYLAFICLIVVSFFATLIFQSYMAELTNNIMYNLELSVIEKVRNASFLSFEKLGSNRLYAAISDARILSRVPQVFVSILTASITLFCSLLYLFSISWRGGLLILGLMAVLLVVYLIRNNKLERDQNKVRDLQDGYYGSLRELLTGFKQVRVSGKRNKNIYEQYILTNRSKAKALNVRVSKGFVINELIGVYCWYFVLGVIIFLLPVLFDISLIQLAVFITSVLFMMGPVTQLVVFVPSLTSFKIALNRINQIDKALVEDALPAVRELPPVKDFHSLRFKNVVYRHGFDDNTTFQLELHDLTISKGEIIFVTGGNGSGKTTFINLLTGLYKATSGKIYIDGKEANWQEMAAFSNNMAVVYSDQYLFTENYDEHDLTTANTLMQSFAGMFNLDGVLRFDEKKKTFHTALSRGQQKRLALMLALLEDKPILILDEWAAEQDPPNRREFYAEWLPLIRNMGKTIIAISHDDDFYHRADRVLKFDYGKISSDSPLAALQEL